MTHSVEPVAYLFRGCGPKLEPHVGKFISQVNVPSLTNSPAELLALSFTKDTPVYLLGLEWKWLTRSPLALGSGAPECIVGKEDSEVEETPWPFSQE